MANDDKARGAGAHTLVLEGRGRLSLTGVTDVQSFDEELITMETCEGVLAVRGEGLHVERLSLENGELVLTGQVQALEYDEGAPTRGGLLSRIFG